MKSLSFILAIIFLLTSSLLLLAPVSAQSLSDPWSSPLNLSHSGAAINPTMVVDNEGTIHVFWSDEFDGPIYTRRDDKEWSNPVPVSVPFDGYTPLLLADSSGYIHAFWTDADRVLQYANVLASAVPTSAWTPSEILASSAVAFDVEIDALDRFHLAYVRDVSSPEAPAGVYYRQSGTRGDGWDRLVLLYQSLYFRTLAPQDAHVEVELANPSDAGQIFVTWDNRPRGRVYLARSADGGLNWSEPQEIDEPELGGGSAIPFDLTVYAQDEKVLLVWDIGGQDAGCGQYYQWSLDGGATWQPRQRFSAGFFSCADYVQILKGQDGPILLLVSAQAYLQAWDGTRWSDPQIQSTLTNFTEPETLQTVELACLHPVLAANQLLVVGCAAGEDGGDIWWLQRELTDIPEWFPQESVWRPLTSVTRSQSRLLSLALVADTQERLHVLWSQTVGGSSSQPGSALHYTRWEGERLWSQPEAILVSPEEPADQAAVALDPAGRLLVVWRRGQNSEIFYSGVSTNQAALPSAWSEPQRVSAPGQMGSAPDILVAEGGDIFVVYAVPVNEGRGIYLTHSTDSGQTWSGPAQVFDAAGAGWIMLDQPRLALKGKDDLYLLWTRYDLRSGQPEPSALVYTHSQDSGESWSAPEIVVEAPIVWSHIVSLGAQTVHRFWQELTAGQTTTLWHERSLDNGQTWERIAPISVFGQSVGSPRLTGDRAGNLHLLQVVSRGTGSYVLQHWIWDGQRWGGSNSLNLDVQAGTILDDMASAVSPSGNLAVILAGRAEDQNVATREDELFFTARAVDLPGGLPTPLPPVPVTPMVTEEQPAVKPTALPTTTPTPNLATLGTGNIDPGSSWSGLVVGGVLAALIVTVVFGLGIWRAKLGR